MLVGLYPAFLLSMFFVISHLNGYMTIPNKYTSLWIVVLIFAITMLSDTFAYLIGSTLKGPKVCPKISPNKIFVSICLNMITPLRGSYY